MFCRILYEEVIYKSKPKCSEGESHIKNQRNHVMGRGKNRAEALRCAKLWRVLGIKEVHVALNMSLMSQFPSLP